MKYLTAIPADTGKAAFLFAVSSGPVCLTCTLRLRYGRSAE